MDVRTEGDIPAPGRSSEGFVRVRGAREHNLKNVSLDIRHSAQFASGVHPVFPDRAKSSLAFGTLYCEAQRRYLESVSPYARRLFHQMAVPDVDTVDGLPPAVALQQQRGSPTTRSSVGSVTTLSNLLRMLYSRAGDYPRGQALLYAEVFFAQYARRRLSQLPWHRPYPRRRRAVVGAGRHLDHTRTSRRGLADRLAGAKPQRTSW